MATETVLINFEVDYDSLTNAQKQLEKTGKIDTKDIEKVQAAINTTATDTKGLIKQFKDVAGVSVKMGKSLEDAFGGGIKDALDSAGVSVDEFAASLKKANAPAITIKKELQQLKEAMARMKAEGKDTGKEFDSLRAKAGKLADAIQDANAEIKNAGSDTRGIDNVVGSISALAGGYAAVQGAAALFGEENEDLQKALLKVNAAMAIASGTQQFFIALQKEGALVKLADSVATGAQTAATTLYTFVTNGATVAARAYRVALLATGIGAAIILVLGLVAAYKSLKSNTESAADQQERLAKATEKLNAAIAVQIDDLDFTTKAQILQAKIAGKSEKEITAIKIKGIEDRIAVNKKAREQAIKDGLDEKELQKSIVQDQDDLILLKLQIQADEAEKLRAARKEAAEKAAADAKIARDKLLAEEIAYLAKVRAAKAADIKEAERISMDADMREFKRKKDFYNKLLAEFKKLKQDELDADADYYEKKWEQAGTDLEKQKADAQAASDFKIQMAGKYLAIAQQTASLLGQIASIQTERDMQEIANKRKVVDEQLKAGAITEKAAEAQRKRIDRLEAKARHDAAVREKKAAAFQAVLAIPQAFLQGLTSAPPPYGAILGAIAAALAAAQAAIIISKPVPKFFRGKKDSYEGPGIVGDMGSELVERDGRMFLYTKPTQTYLGATDKVYTAAETRQILHKTNINTTVKQQPAAQFDYDRLGKAIPASSININIDKDFISESVAGALSRTNYMDRRYRRT